MRADCVSANRHLAGNLDSLLDAVSISVADPARQAFVAAG
jgi:hypothetical protein